MTNRPFSVMALALAACLAAIPFAARAAIIPLESYNTVGGSFTGEVEVTSDGSAATFVFRNTTAGGTSSLASIWFETGFGGIFTGTDATLTQTGVNFALDVTPLGPGNSNPPPAPNDIPSVSWTSNFAKLDRIGAAANGISPGEALMVVFGYSGTEAALVADLLNGFGDRRIALHLISAANGECGPSATSCSIGVSAVPLPPAVWLFLSAVLGLGAVVRRRPKAASAA
jgi:hypothetical protein